MSSLDLSEFFNNDDSDGHRLAEFLQKRRGGVQRPNFLYLNCDTQRKSLHIQLEKLPEKIVENVCNEVEINKQKEDQNLSVEEEIASMHGEPFPSTSLPSTSAQAAPIISPTPVLPEKPLTPPNSVRPLSPSRSLSPQRPLCSSRPLSPSEPLSPSRPLSPSAPMSPSRPLYPSQRLSPSRPLFPSRPLSPRVSAIRKSGGIISPSDKLRRLSLKVLTKKKYGRRTLLQEFESTVDDADFDPPVYSTPMSQPLACPSSPTTDSSPEDNENHLPNSSDKLPSTSGRCENTETLMKSLQHQDEVLQNYMNLFETTLKNIKQHGKDMEKNNTESAGSLSKKSLLQTTKSPLKRTYILEKGQSLGQVILTPEKSVAGRQSPQSRLLKSRNVQSLHKMQQTSNNVKTPDRTSNGSMISIRVRSPSPQLQPLQQSNQSPNRTLKSCKVMVNKSCCKLPNEELQNTPSRNVSLIFPSEDIMDIEIPETQEIPPAVNNSCIMIQSKDNVPVVIIPINQNNNHSNKDNSLKNRTRETEKTAKINLKTASTNIEECPNKPEDNLKLTDILTDDEEYTPKPTSPCAENLFGSNNSQAPLNLAPSVTNGRNKRLRKRSLPRRRLQMDHSQFLSTEAETEPPTAHNNNSAQRKRTIKRKNIPLNRAPGTPLNGERFALELKRMSNYEILDLRKRNSMGHVFPISGCKSSQLQEKSNKKQLQLDDEIEMELLRRNMKGSISNGSLRQKESTTNVHNNISENSPEKLIPAPQEFRDNSGQEEENMQLESSLLEEKSVDRISFKSRRSSLGNKSKRKRKVKNVPKELQQYLEISKILKKKKTINMDQTKRSLYTRGNSDSEQNDADISTNAKKTRQSSDKSISVEMKTTMDQSLKQVPSPPTSETDTMPALRVVSPPPPLTISLRESQVQAEHIEPLPSPENDTDSGVSSRQHNPKQPKTLSNKENDENIFKKPLTPPPLKKKKSVKTNKSKTDNILLNDMNTGQDISTDSSLRRSKRLVTVQHTVPIFQRLFQESYNRCLQNRERHLARQQRLKEISKATLGDNSTINSIKSTTAHSQKLPMKSSTRTRRKKLDTVPEDEPLMSALQNEISKATLGDNSTINSIKSTTAHSQKSPVKASTRTRRKKLDTVPEDEPLMSALQNDMTILNTKKQTKKQSKELRKKNKKDQRKDEQLECSRINLTTPPPVDHFNNVFDHLRNTSTSAEHDYGEAPPPPPPSQALQEEQQQPVNEHIFKGKKLRVRIQRLKSSNSGGESKEKSKTSDPSTNKQLTKFDSTSTRTNSVSSSSSACGVVSNQSNFELLSWLKNITEAENMERNDEIFKDMRISSASNLSFSTLQGLEYAFYDTDDKASLGYLRFKPGQVKPKKKAKRFHLHFITLVGQFRITANDKESRVGPGDMVAIEKQVYYDIENITDDIGILMVVKK